MSSLTRGASFRATVAALLGLALALTGVSAADAATPSFRDVPSSHKFYTQITWLANQGITTGYADGTFRPERSINRAEFAAFLYRMAGSPAVTLPDTSPFTDLKKSDQFYKQIIWAYQAEITNGFADHTYRSKDNITRDAIAAFLYRYEGQPTVPPAGFSPFKDVSASSQFYEEIIWMYTAGITTGYSDGTYRPRGNTAREEIAAFLYRVDGHPLSNPPLTVPTSFTVKGSGYGHGVGMSQYGAYGMALEGNNETQILQHYFTGTSVKSVDANQNIRVEIFGSGSDSRNSVNVVVRSPGSDTTDDGRWIMRFYNKSSSKAHTTWTGKNNEDLMVTRSGTSVKVTRENGTSAVATKDVSLWWEGTSLYQPTSAEDPYVELLTKEGGPRVTHGQYRHGKILISVPNADSPRLILANDLKLNTEYLYGIAEVPSSWHSEALQAQAIAARGYALNADKSYEENCNCNIYDDTRSQNFSGWEKEGESLNGTDAYYGKRWVAAVNETNSSAGTKGQVLTYGGKVVTLYYFSSSGGQTENNGDVWGSQLGYLKSVSDKWSLNSRNPNDSWTYTLTQAKAKSVFGLPNVVSIKVTARTAGGSDAAARVVTATSSSGATATISGPEKIRSGLTNGKSPWIWTFTPKR